MLSSAGCDHSWRRQILSGRRLKDARSCGGGRLKTHQHISAPQDSVLANLHLTLLRGFGIEAENFNGVTDKTISGLLA